MRHIIWFGLAVSLLACGGGEAESDDETSSSTAGDEAMPEDGPAEEAETTDEEPSSLLAVGTPAPDFEVLDQAGVSRQLSAERGHVVVLYFYPRDDTPGCTAEACAFRDVWERYEESDVVVLGVSVDSVESHLAFAQRHQLPFSLLADVDAAIATAYGVATSEGDVVYARRVTYVVNGEGAIAHVFENVDPGVHANEVLEIIAGL